MRIAWAGAKLAMRLDQQLEIRTQRLAHRPDIGNREIFVAAIDETAPRAGERIEFRGGKAHRLDL